MNSFFIVKTAERKQNRWLKINFVVFSSFSNFSVRQLFKNAKEHHRWRIFIWSGFCLEIRLLFYLRLVKVTRSIDNFFSEMKKLLYDFKAQNLQSFFTGKTNKIWFSMVSQWLQKPSVSYLFVFIIITINITPSIVILVIFCYIFHCFILFRYSLPTLVRNERDWLLSQ